MDNRGPESHFLSEEQLGLLERGEAIASLRVEYHQVDNLIARLAAHSTYIARSIVETHDTYPQNPTVRVIQETYEKEIETLQWEQQANAENTAVKAKELLADDQWLVEGRGWVGEIGGEEIELSNTQVKVTKVKVEHRKNESGYHHFWVMRTPDQKRIVADWSQIKGITPCYK